MRRRSWLVGVFGLLVIRCVVSQFFVNLRCTRIAGVSLRVGFVSGVWVYIFAQFCFVVTGSSEGMGFVIVFNVQLQFGLFRVVGFGQGGFDNGSVFSISGFSWVWGRDLRFLGWVLFRKFIIYMEFLKAVGEKNQF